MNAPDVAALLARHPLEWSVEDEGLVYEETAGLSYIGHASDIVPALATALRAALADQRRIEKALRFAAGMLSTTPEFASDHPQYAYDYVLAEVDKDDAALTADGGVK